MEDADNPPSPRVLNISQSAYAFSGDPVSRSFDEAKLTLPDAEDKVSNLAITDRVKFTDFHDFRSGPVVGLKRLSRNGNAVGSCPVPRMSTGKIRTNSQAPFTTRGFQ